MSQHLIPGRCCITGWIIWYYRVCRKTFNIDLYWELKVRCLGCTGWLKLKYTSLLTRHYRPRLCSDKYKLTNEIKNIPFGHLWLLFMSHRRRQHGFDKKDFDLWDDLLGQPVMHLWVGHLFLFTTIASALIRLGALWYTMWQRQKLAL